MRLPVRLHCFNKVRLELWIRVYILECEVSHDDDSRDSGNKLILPKDHEAR